MMTQTRISVLFFHLTLARKFSEVQSGTSCPLQGLNEKRAVKCKQPCRLVNI